MRNLLIFFFAASLFVACNNNKKDDRRSSDRDRERDDYRSRDEEKNDDRRNTDYSDDKDTRDRDNDTRKTDDSGGWSRSEENKFSDDCVAEAEKNVGRSRAVEYCDCMLGKLKQQYSSYGEAERELNSAGEDVINRMAAECNGQ